MYVCMYVVGIDIVATVRLWRDIEEGEGRMRERNLVFSCWAVKSWESKACFVYSSFQVRD